jgi:hypothetical protein
VVGGEWAVCVCVCFVKSVESVSDVHWWSGRPSGSRERFFCGRFGTSRLVPGIVRMVRRFLSVQSSAGGKTAGRVRRMMRGAAIGG